ncbi:GspH/FimT family protein, partial [Xanthomonas campestris pv. campestris]|nr:GspH/FimT family protein [Xanthomonas campestris pv. campestris]
ALLHVRPLGFTDFIASAGTAQWGQVTANAGQPSSALSVLRVEQHATTQSLSVTSTAGRPLIRFMPDGRSGGSNATISLCIQSERVADIVINNSGRARSVRYPVMQSCPAPAQT